MGGAFVDVSIGCMMVVVFIVQVRTDMGRWGKTGVCSSGDMWEEEEDCILQVWAAMGIPCGVKHR